MSKEKEMFYISFSANQRHELGGVEFGYNHWGQVSAYNLEHATMKADRIFKTNYVFVYDSEQYARIFHSSTTLVHSNAESANERHIAAQIFSAQQFMNKREVV